MTKEKNPNIKSNNYSITKIKNLVPGQIVLHPIYRNDGLMLMNKYKLLTSDLINKIKNHIPNNNSIIISPTSKNLVNFVDKKEFNTTNYKKCLDEILINLNKTVLQNSSYQPLNKEKDLVFSQSENTNEKEIYDFLNSIPLFSKLDSNLESTHMQYRARLIKNKFIALLLDNKDLYQLYLLMKDYKEMFLVHSINTTLFSLIAGLTLELTDNEIINLCIASLFSNIGFTRIPKNRFELYLRNKNKQENVLIEHIKIFMEYAHTIPALRNKQIIFGVLDRHEWFNGTGLPNKKRHDEISLFGRILSISESYDEMVGGYSFNKGMSPISAINELWNNKDIKFDSNILRILIYRTSIFKLGKNIALKENQKGEIVGFSDFINYPNLPIIKTENGNYIDLLKHNENI